ncbi:Pre-mRNA-splicing factor of RES complex-domain-containing protein [Zychaea mexicana]|uniref:Pre-mRNA-splicing factor of RES complex-domain-containing protein n=1 Tax=Zychaea mexicana TaxID=64656 RepID=UPI0022FDE494|nr:Pre-mRNA-splicing factor of RES complex-domain-containing protein [Zychaea mexicana]KAI9494650.1 Pre-mRNA-splicing factor of RES complex-domain-containing protein [Zychaea mexicana]
MQQPRRILPKKKVVKKGNLGIVDDEESGWKPVHDTDRQQERKRREAAEQEQLLESSTGVFRGRTDGWQTVQEGATGSKRMDIDDENDENDERPVFVNNTGEEIVGQEQEQLVRDLGEAGAASAKAKSSKVVAEGPKMSSGQRAGLLTSHEIKQEAARAREAEMQMVQQLQGDRSGRDAETVYRDETGRRIDPKIKRAEEARAKKEAIEREEQRMEWGKGLVQRSEVEAQRRQLEEEKNQPLARYADDQDYNQGLREQQRWNDPAAGFLTSEGKSKGLVRPRYKGAWKPNRYMIPPGYRWDGVDRSNGFEDSFLLRENQKKARAIEAHAWSTEDM